MPRTNDSEKNLREAQNYEPPDQYSNFTLLTAPSSSVQIKTASPRAPGDGIDKLTSRYQLHNTAIILEV